MIKMRIGTQLSVLVRVRRRFFSGSRCVKNKFCVKLSVAQVHQKFCQQPLQKISNKSNFYLQMSFIPLLSLVCVLSAINALPVSVLPVRQYVFLAPELPKFQLKPAQLKLQTEPLIQSLAKYKNILFFAIHFW